jgi:PD-(D/E)XK nuclease superfamily protein
MLTKPEEHDLFGELAQTPGASGRRNDVRKGDAAEAFVIAKLLSWGYDAHDARRDLPYDVLVDLGPGRVCRLQVKCRSHAQNDRWSYRVIRGNWRSATGTYGYEAGDYDAAVFFALSLEKALFVPGIVPHASFRTDDFLRPGAEIDSWRRVIDTLAFRS